LVQSHVYDVQAVNPYGKDLRSARSCIEPSFDRSGYVADWLSVVFWVHPDFARAALIVT